MPSIRERVDSGAATLDADRPGWRRSIKPDTLDMAMADSCILAQVYGSYSAALDTLELGRSGTGDTPTSCGYYAGPDEHLLTNWWILRDLWIAEAAFGYKCLCCGYLLDSEYEESNKGLCADCHLGQCPNGKRGSHG